MAPTLSVVISCRNEARWLPRQLATLRTQEVEGWVDTVVVDDGSTDGTHEVAERHGRDLPGFRVVRTPPTNRATAINVGIAESRGDAVVFLDGDDEVAPGYLAAMRRALADHRFVAARRDHVTLNPAWTRRVRSHGQATGLSFEPQRPWPVAGGGTVGVHREVLDAVGGCDATLDYAQDTDLCWRIAQRGVRLVFVPDAVLLYRYRPSASTLFGQARRYGRGGVGLDHRFGTGRSPARIAWRSLALLAQVLRPPTCITPSGRATTAFRVGHLIGWLEAAWWPRRFYSAAALAPVVPAPADGVPASICGRDRTASPTARRAARRRPAE